MLDKLEAWLRRNCLSILCRICANEALLPQSVQIPICYDQKSPPLAYGGYSEVWKGQYKGCEVAVKVLKVYEPSEVDAITRVS
jgi:hypothetical protein